MSCWIEDPILVMQKVPVYPRKTDGQILILAHIARQKETSRKQDLNFSTPVNYNHRIVPEDHNEIRDETKQKQKMAKTLMLLILIHLVSVLVHS